MGQTSYFKQKRSVTGANVCVTQRYFLEPAESQDENPLLKLGHRHCKLPQACVFWYQ